MGCDAELFPCGMGKMIARKREKARWKTVMDWSGSWAHLSSSAARSFAARAGSPGFQQTCPISPGQVRSAERIFRGLRNNSWCELSPDLTASSRAAPWRFHQTRSISFRVALQVGSARANERREHIHVAPCLPQNAIYVTVPFELDRPTDDYQSAPFHRSRPAATRQ
jgi:hypothetical protein